MPKFRLALMIDPPDQKYPPPSNLRRLSRVCVGIFQLNIGPAAIWSTGRICPPKSTLPRWKANAQHHLVHMGTGIPESRRDPERKMHKRGINVRTGFVSIAGFEARGVAGKAQVGGIDPDVFPILRGRHHGAQIAREFRGPKAGRKSQEQSREELESDRMNVHGYVLGGKSNSKTNMIGTSYRPGLLAKPAIQVLDYPSVFERLHRHTPKRMIFSARKASARNLRIRDDQNRREHGAYLFIA